MKKYKTMSIFTLASVIGLAGCNTQSSEGESADADTFYQDQDVSIVIPYDTGGGTDVFGRFAGPYFGKHLAGEPDVQPKNIPGGGSITGTNEYANAMDADGYNLLATSGSTHIPFLLEQESVEYDLSKLKPVLGFPTGGVVYTSPSTGIEEPGDLENVEEELTYAGISASGLDLVTLLAFEVLDLDVDAVMGYEGRGPSRVAFEQGESNIDYQTTSAYTESVEPMVESGDAVPLFTFGQVNDKGELERDPAFPDIPTLQEVYEEIHGESPSGIEWDSYLDFVSASYTIQKIIWVHEDAPDASHESLEASVEEMIEDDQFLEEGAEVLENYEPFEKEELESLVDNMTDTNDDVIEWVQQYLKEEYDTDVSEL
ncbi:Bug family tripartite tricarboxylate transporter substrate binding protein [Alteribacillus sp. HJP-4]|uniref:Bug family tripartite tricarboxylate transporter substrate binding protein n=1 Tax=Alteribacillus sp. HJP-4 TaxID=2775394 RepID=UPI0035CCD7F7